MYEYVHLTLVDMKDNLSDVYNATWETLAS